MFFVLAKILGFFALPPNILISPGLLGVLLTATRVALAGIMSRGGALDTAVSPARGEVALNEAAERVTSIAELARRYPDARIVFTGGSGRIIYDGVSEAELAARLFASFG